MIDERATYAQFGRIGTGQTQPCIAVCPECGVSRKTSIKFADGACSKCSQKSCGIPLFRRITVKTPAQRGLPI